jgi:hypothetical protein
VRVMWPAAALCMLQPCCVHLSVLQGQLCVTSRVAVRVPSTSSLQSAGQAWHASIKGLTCCVGLCRTFFTTPLLPEPITATSWRSDRTILLLLLGLLFPLPLLLLAAAAVPWLDCCVSVPPAAAAALLLLPSPLLSSPESATCVLDDGLVPCCGWSNRMQSSCCTFSGSTSLQSSTTQQRTLLPMSCNEPKCTVPSYSATWLDVLNVITEPV